MKRILIALVFALVSSFAFAEGNNVSVTGAGFDKLSDVQKAEIIAQVAKAAEANKANTASTVVETVKTSTPEKVASWVDVGTKIGQALGGAAKEVGVAVNDFAKSPVGKVTMAIIVWQYMGGVIVHMFGGILVMIVGLTIIWLLMRREAPMVTEYHPEKRDFLGRSVIVSQVRPKLTGDSIAGYLCAVGIVLVAGLITIFSY